MEWNNAEPQGRADEKEFQYYQIYDICPLAIVQSNTWGMLEDCSVSISPDRPDWGCNLCTQITYQ